MQNFRIVFSYPLLLLLLIPAIALTLLPYFRLSKRYRRTRNRITSIVLHLAVMVLSVCTLAGMVFRYQIPNEENEIILLVDVSDTEKESADKRDEFIRNLLRDSRYDGYRVGVITFGYDQEYAVPLTTEIDEIFERYQNADLPDTSATNLTAALNFAKDKFKNPQTSKIVLITDGKETDEQKYSASAARSLSTQGTKVDVAYIPSGYEGLDVQLVGVEMPQTHLSYGTEFKMNLLVESKEPTEVVIELSDNGEINTTTGIQTIMLASGLQKLTFSHTFTVSKEDAVLSSGELHELRFKITEKDVIEENNEYCFYHYLEIYNDILILEHETGESEHIVSMLGEDSYNITIKNIKDSDIPVTVEGLRAYDQVILNNISNAELKAVVTNDSSKTFDKIIETYVSEFGGGLFTVGGNVESGNVESDANAYNRADMFSSTYQQMLPVQAINYTPPVAVMIIVDRSGSMGTGDEFGNSKLSWAREGAINCLTALTERDYIGVMTLDSEFEVILPMTPRTQDQAIREAIMSIDSTTGATYFDKPLEYATQTLAAMENVARRHIMIVSDCQIGASQEENYLPWVQKYNQSHGVTVSVVATGVSEGDQYWELMQRLVSPEYGNGRLILTSDPSEMVNSMKEELNEDPIKEVNHEEFNPIIAAANSPLFMGLERVKDEKGEEISNKLNMKLGGFYGVKMKANAELLLTGEHNVPLYAQWKYGNGSVGSFMCDLAGSAWSKDFVTNANAQILLRNIVNNLMPLENIEPEDIFVELKEDNYTNKMSVYTSLKEGEYIKGEIINTKDETQTISLNEITSTDPGVLRESTLYVTSALSEANNYSRCDFVVKGTGVYRIVLTKYVKDESGAEKVVSQFETYKDFAYSTEYDSFVDETLIPENMATIAERGKGAVIEDLEDPWEVFDGFITAIDKEFDPRFLFMILALVLFLLDIAVRKFKFKWPHELIRERKKRNESEQK